MEYHRSNDSLRHARRREVIDRIRWKVRKHIELKAERINGSPRIGHYWESREGEKWYQVPDVEAMYLRAMIDEGRYAFGGCGCSQCRCCHWNKIYNILSSQMIRIEQKAKEELEEFSHNTFDYLDGE